MNKIFKLIFIILLLITSLELIYYFFLIRNNDSLLISSDKMENNNNVENKSPIDIDLVSNMLNPIDPIGRDLVKLFLITAELEGEITEINVPTPYVPKDKYERVLRFEFVIKGKEGNTHKLQNSYDFYKQKSIIKVIGRNKEELEISNLKIGDKINLKVESNLTDSKEGTSIYTWTITQI